MVSVPKYPIGTRFKTRGKHPRDCVVTDYRFTYNAKGELVKMRYVTAHDFMGQVLEDTDVAETTIAMGLA